MVRGRCTVPFIVAGTLFVIFALLVGLGASLGPTVYEAQNVAKELSADALDKAQSALVNLNGSSSTVTTRIGTAITRLSNAYIDKILATLRTDVRNVMFGWLRDSISPVVGEVVRTGTNMTTFAHVLQCVNSFLTGPALESELTVVCDGGFDYRYIGAASDAQGGYAYNITVDGSSFTAVKAPIRAAMFYGPTMVVPPPFNWDPNHAGIILYFNKHLKTEVLAWLAAQDPTYATHMRNENNWGLFDQVRVVQTGDAGYTDSNAVDIGNGFKKLFPIDDPEKHLLAVKFQYDVVNRSVVPGSVCGSKISTSGGTCWASAWNDTALLQPVLFDLGPNDTIPAVVTSASPFSMAKLRWSYMSQHILPGKLLPNLRLPEAYSGGLPDHQQVLGVIIGATRLSGVSSRVSSLISQSAFVGTTAVVHNSVGTFISSSIHAGSTLGANIVNVSHAVCGETLVESIAYSVFLAARGGWSAVTDGMELCMPGSLILAAEAWMASGRCRSVLSAIFEAADDPQFLVSHFTNSTTSIPFSTGACGNYPNDHPNDTVVFVREILDSLKDFDNESGPDVPFSAEYRSCPLTANIFSPKLFVALFVPFSEVRKESVSARVDIATASAVADLNIRTARIEITDQRDTEMQLLMRTMIIIVVVVAVFVVAAAAGLFYWALSPLHYVLDALMHVEDFDLYGATDVLSNMSTVFTEFQRTKAGVQTMVDRLVEYRRYLPEWVIAREHGGDGGDDLSANVVISAFELIPSGEALRSQKMNTSRSAGSRKSAGSSSIQASSRVLPAQGIAHAGLGLENRSVCTLIVHLPLSGGAGAVIPWLTAAEPIVRRFRGSMSPDTVSAYSDGIAISILFNAQTSCRSMVTHALDCASRLQELPPSGISCGVSALACVCGSVGTDSQRWYVSTGLAGASARCLANLAPKIGVSILCDSYSFERTFSEQSAFTHFPVFPVVLSGPGFTDTHQRLVAVIQRLEQTSDEWMYMLEEAGDKQNDSASVENRFARLADVFSESYDVAIDRTRFEKAIAAAKSSVENHENDTVQPKMKGYLRVLDDLLARHSGATLHFAPARMNVYDYSDIMVLQS